MQKQTSTFLRTVGFCLIVLTLLALLAACGSTSPPTSSHPTQAPTATAPTSSAPSVTISNFTFSPATLTVSVGTKVTWTNKDSVTHTVTADQGAFDSDDLSPGHSFSFTFTKAGTYTYHCKIHASMTATIIVS